MEDIPYHIPTAFKIGDRVRVVKIVKEAHAWHSKWYDSMSPAIGCNGSLNIIAVSPVRGFSCRCKPNIEEYWFPSPALELANESVIIEVPAVDATTVMLDVSRGPRKKSTEA